MDKTVTLPFWNQAPPLDMASFFAASQGSWLIRRAVHHLDYQDDEKGDSNLICEPFDREDSSISKLCDSFGVDPASAGGGARFWWENNSIQGPRDPENAAILVDLPNKEDKSKGFLLRDKGYVEKAAVISTYRFTEDGVLSITTRYDTNVGIERCWFVTDQVRMRVSSVQFLDGVSMTTYCTELRCPNEKTIKAIAAQAQMLAES